MASREGETKWGRQRDGSTVEIVIEPLFQTFVPVGVVDYHFLYVPRDRAASTSLPCSGKLS